MPLINKVYAQSAPTFPYDGPFERPGSQTTGDEGTIRLISQTQTVQVGSTITADIKIESQEAELVSYTIFITYNPQLLEVTDSDLAKTGVQIDFIDTLATEQTNTVDATNGTIRIVGQIQGSAQSVNRIIGRISFKGKASGASIVSINKGASSLIDSDNKNILTSTTTLNFTVTGESTTGTTTISPTGTTTASGQLPPSGIFDTLAAIGGIFSGVLMLYVGVKTLMIKKEGVRE